MNLPPGTAFGPYDIVAALGTGGMGEVYRARDRRLNRQVALKLLPAALASDPVRRARFTREAHLLASLNHPNIAQVYGFEDAGDTAVPPALAMELVEGPTLAERIAAGAMPLGEAVGVAVQIAQAMEYAHGCGVIHRDLKPANIKLRPDGTVKVLDFGLAKALEDAGRSPSADEPTLVVADTQPGAVLGTASYMAPEQVRGLAVDRRADVWAFGVIVFEMLTGQQPFSGPSASDVMAAVIRDEPPWAALPPETPHGIRNVLRLCLERDPRQRLRDIGDASLLLRTAERQELPHSRPPILRRNHVLLPIALAVTTAVAIAALIALWLPREKARSTPLRFTIPQPTSVAMNQQTIMTMLAVSPDGGRIATVTSEGLLVWVAETGTAERLEDTAGAIAPFFSPDGNDVAFFARDELRSVPVAGGPTRLITAAAGANAGTWGRDGTIIFTRWLGPEIGLWQVSARGGTPRMIAPASRLAELRAFPSFLPDGRHYIFLLGAYGQPVGQRRLCVANVDGGEPECIASADSLALYSATGHLVFVRAGALVAVPFDVERLRVGEGVVTLSRTVRWFGPVGVAMFGVSANGRTLVYALPAQPRRLQWVDRAGTVLQQLAEPRLYNQVFLSPDGRRAAVDIWNTETGARDLWTIDLASSDLSRVTVNAIDTFLGGWSADSRSLLYGMPTDAPPDVYEISVAGAPPRALLTMPGVQLAQDRSRDGWLAYLEVFTDRDSRRLWLVPPGGTPRRLRNTPANTWDARFSPDARWLAYVSDESGTPEVYVAAHAQDGAPRRVSRGSGFQPRWRGDSRELIYVRTDGMFMSVDPAANPPEPTALFRIDGVTPEDAPTPPRERVVTFDVNSDGQRLLLRVAVNPGGRADDLRVWMDWASALR